MFLTRYSFIIWVISLITALISGCDITGQANSKQAVAPNIVLIITDDQGIGDLGIMENPVIETPHIDEMARNSAFMERFYVSPVCAPTRACLMTGRYNYRTRVVDTYIGRAMMEPKEVTVAEALQQGGYATGIFGKWHLGDNYPMRPLDQGFEEALIHKGGGLAQPSEPFGNDRRYTNPILFHNGEQIQTEGYCTDIYFDAALDFMGKKVENEQPFFTYIATNAPHGPYHDVPEDLYKKYLSKDLSTVFKDPDWDQTEQQDRVARIFAMIENIDQNVGKLFEQLDKWEIMENTVVIFMVDNGPNSRRYVRELRGMKSEVHEGGIRSPFFVHWPARLQAGHSSDRIAAHIDIMPTLLDAAGVKLPKEVQLDGKSVLPLLENQSTEWEDRTLFIQTHRGDVPQPRYHFAAIEQEWKLVHPTGFGRREVDPQTVPYELYNLVQDPGEQHNLYETQPEIAERLTTAYDQWFEEVSNTRPDNYAPPRMVIGTAEETTTHLTAQDWRRTAGEGWGTDGYWLLEVAQPAEFEVILKTPEKLSPLSATLTINDTLTMEATAEAPSSILSLGSIALEPGEIKLQVKPGNSDIDLGQYQVEVIKL